MGQKEAPIREGELAQFQHTQLGVYLAGAFGVCYVWSSSAQGIVDRYHFSKKWFYLYGVLVAFAYLYMRPFVRRGLGSAHRGYLNFYSLYILWLCTALFCHLPSLEALGLDIRADITLALSIAASSLLVLGVLHGLQALLIHFKWLAPAPGATQQALWSCIILNSITLSAACSTYFQLCGNGAAGPRSSSSSQVSSLSTVLHDAVCVKYLAPIATKEYPTFSAWMLYGERNSSSPSTRAAAAAAGRQNSCSSGGGSWFSFGSSSNSSCEQYSPSVVNNSSSLVEFVMSVPVGADDDGGSVISPVFTLWITLVTLYIINVVIDHISAADMSARHISELRRERVKDPDLALLAALSQAAGETFRQGAHHLAAAQQQRHQQQPVGEGPEAMKDSLGAKRSKSMEISSSARQPWSPRFMAERTLVNLLETTSSFSFKAAALLEGIETKGFPTWQQLQSQARLGSLGLGGLTTLGDRLGSIKNTGVSAWGQAKRQQQQQWNKQQDVDRQRLRRASTDGGEGVEKEQQQKQQRQRRQQKQPEQANGRVDGCGGPGRGLYHTRSKSLSSIQSAGTASGRDDDDVLVEALSGQPRQGTLGTGGEPPHSRQRAVKAQQAATSTPVEQHQRLDQPNLGSSGDSSSSLQSVGSSRQQQQQGISKTLRHNTGSFCSSPFAATQNGVGFGAYGGFGSAVSLYSPGAEGYEARALEQLLATAATADGGVPLAAGLTTYAQDSSTGVSGGAATGVVGQPGSNRVADTNQPVPAVEGTATAGPHPAAASPTGLTQSPDASSAPPPPLSVQLTTRGKTQDSEWSDLADWDGSGDRSQADGVPGRGGYDGPSPPFLDMVPWYSGTSADLFKTMFDLMISLKLFLGRFDMRTMQAATAASMADSFNDTPSEGDGFTYEHYHNKEELWFDFIADTGDGGNSTYAVARALAAPSLTVSANDVMKRTQQQQQQEQQQRPQLLIDTGGRDSSSSDRQHQEQLQLPRGDVLLIGGDLAYPNPSRDTYEQRLFVPFQEAMPPPPHYHPGRLVVHKPDLPPAFGVHEGLAAQRPCPAGLSPRSSRYASVAALRGYTGPNVFAIPGNHDWIDGLETFIKHIMHKGWLGGWLMPQEKSYFALRLPAGWWVFGLDLALVGDIDMCQYRYFANVVERRLGPEDNVIIITHEPTWLLEWFWASSSSSNLRQLVRGHLRGRARVHLAGDLHFYMRHSFVGNKQQKQPGGAGQASTVDATVTSPGTTAGVAAAVEGKVAAADELLQMPSVSPTEGLSAAVSWTPGEEQQEGGQGSAAQASYGLAAAAGTSLLDIGLAVNGSHSRRTSSSSSSSSGVESCNTPLPEHQQQRFEGAVPLSAAAGSESSRSSSPAPTGYPGAAPAGASMSSPGGSSRSSSSKGSGHDAAAAISCSPVDLACQTLPRLVVAAPASRHSSGDLGYRISNSSSSTSYSQPAAAGAGAGVRPGVTWAVPDDAAAVTRAQASGRRTKKPSELHQHQQQEPNLLDPEHLIVNGMGGAFLHPTHIFSYSRFACLEDEAAAATAAIYSSAEGDSSTSYTSAVPISSASSSSSLAAAVSGPHLHSSQGPAGQYRHPSARSMSLSAWDPELLSWHCPMSPSGTSDIWDQHSLQGLTHLNLGPAAAAGDATTGKVANGHAAAGVEHDPVPVLAARKRPTAAAAAAEGQRGGSSADGASAPSTVPAAAGTAAGGGGGSGVTGGVYKCAALFPSAEKSRRLGRKNLHLFRFKNSRFDVIGGGIYFLSIVSTLPRCNAGLALLSATSLLDFIGTFLAEFAATWYDIIMNSYLSVLTVVMFFLLCLGFAKGGGVGAVSGERQQLQREQKRQRKLAQQQQQQQAGSGGSSGAGAGGGVMQRCSMKKAGRRSPVVGPLVKLRTGGTSTQLLVAALHAGTHLSLAVVLLLLLELGVEVCIKYEQLGNDGHHSMYHWFEAYQDQHFPDPMGLRDMAHRWSWGVYPGVIKAAMAVYDIPEAIAVARNAVCSAGSVAAGFAGLSRVQLLAYYAGMLAYYWMLAIPAMGFVFGLYLYVCVCWFHVHYDEAFSALRIANFKGMTRLHITKEGDLEIFTLGIDRVPTAWREDPKWFGDEGAGSGKVAAHAASYPSRWVPAGPSKGGASDAVQADDSLSGSGVSAAAGDDPSMGLRVVDYLRVPRQRPGLSSL